MKMSEEIFRLRDLTCLMEVVPKSSSEGKIADRLYLNGERMIPAEIVFRKENGPIVKRKVYVIGRTSDEPIQIIFYERIIEDKKARTRAIYHYDICSQGVDLEQMISYRELD